MKHIFRQFDSWKTSRLVWEGAGDKPMAAPQPAPEAAAKAPAEGQPDPKAAEAAQAERARLTIEARDRAAREAATAAEAAGKDPTAAVGAAQAETDAEAKAAVEGTAFAAGTGAALGGMDGFIKTMEKLMDKISAWIDKLVGSWDKKSEKKGDSFSSSPAGPNKTVNIKEAFNTTNGTVGLELEGNGSVYAVEGGKVTAVDPTAKTIEVTMDNGTILTYVDVIANAALPKPPDGVIAAGTNIGSAPPSGLIHFSIADKDKVKRDPTNLFNAYKPEVKS